MGGAWLFAREVRFPRVMLALEVRVGCPVWPFAEAGGGLPGLFCRLRSPPDGSALVAGLFGGRGWWDPPPCATPSYCLCICEGGVPTGSRVLGVMVGEGASIFSVAAPSLSRLAKGRPPVRPVDQGSADRMALFLRSRAQPHGHFFVLARPKRICTFRLPRAQPNVHSFCPAGPSRASTFRICGARPGPNRSNTFGAFGPNRICASRFRHARPGPIKPALFGVTGPDRMCTFQLCRARHQGHFSPVAGPSRMGTFSP